MIPQNMMLFFILSYFSCFSSFSLCSPLISFCLLLSLPGSVFYTCFLRVPLFRSFLFFSFLLLKKTLSSIQFNSFSYSETEPACNVSLTIRWIGTGVVLWNQSSLWQSIPCLWSTEMSGSREPVSQNNDERQIHDLILLLKKEKAFTRTVRFHPEIQK